MTPRPNKIARYTKGINIRIKPETYTKLLTQAEREKREPSGLVRKLIEEYLNNKEGK